ncbi:MAG TPA: HNH endonuclease [Xanthobacteraceae bacterium]
MGRFYWRVRCGTAAPGRQAGTWHGGGYRSIRIDGVLYLEHRLAWFYVHGKHPRRQIDHRNRIRTDNRIANLRECSCAQNRCNVVTRNATGFKGVYRHYEKWQTHIQLRGKRIYLGVHDTPEAAAAAYDNGAHRYHGEFARTNASRGAERRVRGKVSATSLMPRRVRSSWRSPAFRPRRWYRIASGARKMTMPRQRVAPRRRGKIR